jgi:PAS domain S-box-containing protein
MCLRFEQECVFVLKDGVRERDRYHRMSNARQTRRVTSESSETLLTILETLPDAFFVVDETETIVYANASAQAILGATPEECLGNSFWRCAPQLVSTALYQAVRTTRETQEPTDVEYVSPVTQRWLHVQLAPIVGRLTLQFHEMSETARRQEMFPQSECLSLDDLDGLHTRIGILTPEGIVLEVNEVPLDDAHIQREEVIGKPLAKTPWWSFAPASQEQLRAAIARANMGETVRFEALLRPREEMVLSFESAITSHMDADHHIEYLVIAGIDITVRKRAEADIHALIDAIPQLVWTGRPDGYIDYYNQRWRDYTGLTTELAQGNGWMQCTHPDDRQRVLAVWQRAVQTGRLYETEQRLRQSTTGAYRWFLMQAVPFKDSQGTILKYVGTCTDIDEQKRAEEALRQSQERIRALIDSNMIGIVSVEGEEEVLVEANEAFLHLTGYTQEDMRSKTLNRVKITPLEHAPFFQHAIQEVNARGQHTPLETEVICKDGSRLPVLVGSVIFQEHPRQTISFVLDNSARKELEQRKDDFISMASHELRNPLAAVKMQTQLVQKRLERQSHHEAATALSRVEGPVKQLERLIGELLDVSKIQAGRLEYVQEPVDLEALLHEVAETMQQMSTTHSVVVRGAAPHTIIGDQGRLEQVFINLISNAIKYSPDAKTVEIDLSASEDVVTICVRDHGLGIPREQRDKIFERFYRATGPRQKAIPGLGMGLYIVAEIVKRHGGTITVDSAVGKGSTFTVTLPRKRDA